MSDRNLVDALLAIESGLTAWEIDFIESLDKWLAEKGELTDSQRDVARRLLEDRK